jgi:hypothetical protein
MTLPYKEPSQVLAGLLGTIIEEGRRFASAGDMKISDMSAQSPVGTTLAILERTLKVMSAIQARIHYSMKQEFKLLKGIIADYTPEEYSYEPVEGSPRAKKADYDNVEVIPVSDPNAATMAQKIVQYQAVLQLAQQAPQLYNLPLLHRQMLEVLGIKNAAKLIPMQEDQKPADPVTENMDAIRGKPLKAFIYQDQDAHITSHSSFIQDPMTQKMLEQNPAGQAIIAQMQAHMAEHFAFKYRQQIEQQLGAPLPYSEETPDKDREVIPEEYEVQISRLVAQAGVQLLTMNQQQMAQAQAAQQAQDPIIQMQQQELALKGQEVQRKTLKDQTDAQLKNRQLDIEELRIASNEEIEGTKLGVKMAKDKDAQDFTEELEGTKLGIEIARSKEQANKPTKGD